MMVYKGGFSHTEMYNMPIHMRRFYIEEYREWRKEENKSQEDSEQQQNQAYEAYSKGQQNSD